MNGGEDDWAGAGHVYTRRLLTATRRKNVRQKHKVSSCSIFCMICLNINLLWMEHIEIEMETFRIFVLCRAVYLRRDDSYPFMFAITCMVDIITSREVFSNIQKWWCKDKKVYFTERFIWKHDVMTTIVVIVISYKYSFVILHRHCPLYIHVQQQPVAGDVFIKPPLSGPRIAFDWYLVLVAERGVAQPMFIQMVRSSGGSRGGYFLLGGKNFLNPFLLQFFSSFSSTLQFFFLFLA